MLVVVALVILMMTILVQIFQSATGAMSASRAIQELDVNLRQVDVMLKTDLGGITAKMTPPNDPSLDQGYFEYGENAFADFQGEDSDDYLAFTTKAPEGQVFTGRVYIPNSSATSNVAGNISIQPVTVSSQYAEVIYFLRNGNLYRRVFLIAPERYGSLVGGNALGFTPALYNGQVVSWLAVNDVSCRPNTTVGSVSPFTAPTPNTLGDLTNRENRAFHPRFASDFFTNSTGTNPPDGIDDDFNGDDIPDFYPTLYYNIVANGIGIGGNYLIHEAQVQNNPSRAAASFDLHAFPYIFPGMFSQSDDVTAGGNGARIHNLDPSGTTFNHSPLLLGDNLGVPTGSAQAQTWWGFPTWRETLSRHWGDPVQGLGVNGYTKQPPGLIQLNPSVGVTSLGANYGGSLLPPVLNAFNPDGVGSTGNATSFWDFEPNSGNPVFDPTNANYTPARLLWDDDLILTNVRSFDVKAYDPDAALYNAINFYNAGYYDLGYGVGTPAIGASANPPSGLQTNSLLLSGTPTSLWDDNNNPRGFGHQGRMPPFVSDNRLNPLRPFNLNGTPNNVGDNGSNVVRLARVFDTWSTAYTSAPDVDVNGNGAPINLLSGNANFLPIYPSYPAPYPAALRGIQIQIRVSDPRGERTKVLTIRHDFTDNL
jgi:hypothetical protein